MLLMIAIPPGYVFFRLDVQNLRDADGKIAIPYMGVVFENGSKTREEREKSERRTREDGTRNFAKSGHLSHRRPPDMGNAIKTKLNEKKGTNNVSC
jgi:hypothetical protein